MSDCCKKTERNEEEKKQLLIRIKRIDGQLAGIKKMIEEDKYCNDILISCSRKIIKKFGKSYV